MLDRTIAPAFVEIPEIQLLEAEQGLLNNSIPFHYINGGKPEVIKLEVILNGGKWYEDRNGAAFFTVRMLREGTASYTSEEISNILDQYGAFLELGSSYDHANISLYCLNKHLEKVLPVFYEIIHKPTFPEESLELMKTIEAQRLEINLKKSAYKAQRIYRSTIFPEDSTYGRSISVDEISQLTTEDLKQHFKANYQSYEIFASGNFEADTLKTVLEDYFKDGTPIEKSTQQLDLTSYRAQSKYEEIDGSMQTSIRLGLPTIDKGHKDYISLKIVNHLLGGYFGSRLMKNIREDKGFTYGIYSSVVSLLKASYLVIGADVIKASSEEAIEEIKKEIKSLQLDDVPLQEIETVKNHITGSFQADITSPFDLIDKYKAIYLYNLSYDYYRQYFDFLVNLDATEIKRIANEYFEIDKMSVIKVG